MKIDERVRALSDVDRLIHEPARLTILTVLKSCQSAEFLYLHRAANLTLGNLSQHLSKLEAAEFITIEKTIVKKRTLTTVQLTPKGRQAIDDHWLRLDEARKSADRSWKKKLEAAMTAKLVPVPEG